MSKLTQGALFSGSGGFELAGLLHGIEPVWASEVEPFAVRVTTKRFPDVKHVGDINKLDGAELPPVDIISGGFPCQNLSHAGKRAGLHGERSGLFFEMVRVIREMRQATGKPRFVVVENVMGLYSSNQGRDFWEVLNALCKIKDETVSIPMPKKKWLGAGEIMGDNFSLAWRSLCASLWGVPQRRRRCYLVIDFDGLSAGEILFNESRLSGDFAPCGEPGKSSAGDSAACTGSPSKQVIGFQPGAASRLGNHCWNEMVGTLTVDSGDNLPAVVYDARGNGSGDVANTLVGNHENRITDYTKVAVMPKVYGMASYYSNAMKSASKTSGIYEAETARTLDTSSTDPNKNAGGMMVVCLEGNADRPSHRGDGINETGLCYTLNCVEQHKVAYEETYAMTTGSYTQACKEQSPTLQHRDFKDPPVVNESQYVVRRLTPQECAMLQGLSPAWCDGLETPNPTEEDIAFWSEVFETHRIIVGKAKKPKTRNQIIKWLKNPYTDSAAYKLFGNGIAIPCGAFVLGGIAYYATQFPPVR